MFNFVERYLLLFLNSVFQYVSSSTINKIYFFHKLKICRSQTEWPSQTSLIELVLKFWFFGKKRAHVTFTCPPRPILPYWQPPPLFDPKTTNKKNTGVKSERDSFYLVFKPPFLKSKRSVYFLAYASE